MDQDMQRRLEAHLHRSEILAIVHRCARGVDRWDAELIRSCYFEDAIDDHGDGFVGNVEDFIEYARETARDLVSTQHAICNHVCELDGSDAYAETYYLCLALVPSGQNILSAGRYIDHFQRRGEEWRIATRVVVMENNYELANSSLFPIIPPALATGDGQPWSRSRDDVSYHRPPRARAPRSTWKT